eukprot:EG_transcript_21393
MPGGHTSLLPSLPRGCLRAMSDLLSPPPNPDRFVCTSGAGLTSLNHQMYWREPFVGRFGVHVVICLPVMCPGHCTSPSLAPAHCILPRSPPSPSRRRASATWLGRSPPPVCTAALTAPPVHRAFHTRLAAASRTL